MRGLDWFSSRGDDLLSLITMLDDQAVGSATEFASTIAREESWDEVHRIERLADPAVRDLLRRAPVGIEQEVTVVWASDSCAGTMRFQDFVDRYDDWWYPSSDDVWVFDASDDWLIELDHEEFVRIRTSTADRATS